MTEFTAGTLEEAVCDNISVRTIPQFIPSPQEQAEPESKRAYSDEGNSWTDVQRKIESLDLVDQRSVIQDAAERVVALLCLVLFSPVLLGLALYIRLDSPGSPLFRQWRVGKNGKLFRFYKFRTLYADAKTRFPEWYAYRYSPDDLERLYFKVEADPRVTRAGRFLRCSTLDELPNFINVLKGDMSLVGPRPEIPEMLQYYQPECLVKFRVKPGVTGVAQVSGRGRLLFRETEAIDAESVFERGPVRDIKVMLRTIYLICKRDGAF